MSKSLFSKIQPDTLDAFREHLNSQGASEKSIKRKESSIKKFVNWADKQGYIQETVSSKPNSIVFSSRRTASWKLAIPIFGIIIIFLLVVAIPKTINLFSSAIELTVNKTTQLLSQDNKTTSKTKSGLASPRTKSETGPIIASAQSPWVITFRGNVTGIGVQAEPETAKAIFRLYTQKEGGETIWTSKEWQLTPDSNGQFQIPIGLASQGDNEIPSSFFFQNENLYLGMSLNGQTEVSPRTPVSTAANAANANLLQQYPPAQEAGPLTIPVITQNGELLLASSNPTIKATSGNLAIQGEAITLSTPAGSDGNITLAPDGTGKLNLLFNSQTGNSVNAQNANLINGALYSGVIGNNAGTADLISLSSGSTPTEKFSVDAKGNLFTAGEAIITKNVQALKDINLTGNLNVGGVTRLNSGGQLGNITGYQQSSGNFTVSQGAPDAVKITKTGVTASADSLTFSLDETSQTASNYDTLVLSRLGGSSEAYALYVKDGNARLAGTLRVDQGLTAAEDLTVGQNATINGNANVSGNISASGQIQTGRFASNPTALGAGSIIYNTGDNQLYFWNGSAWTTVAGVGGSGTTNYLPKWSASTTLGNSLLYDDGTNIGIGTTAAIYQFQISNSLGVGGTAWFGSYLGIGNTAPTQRLDIAGNATISGSLGFGPNAPAYAGTCNAANAGKQYYDGTDNKMYYCNGTSWIVMGTSSSVTGTGTANYLPIWTNASTLANSSIYETGGSVGIGKTNPGYTLDINGSLGVGGTGYFASNLGIGTTAPVGLLAVGNASQFQVNSSGAITSTATGDVVTLSGAGANISFTGAGLAQIKTAAAQNLALMPGGNVGIGTTAPGANLEVNGGAGNNATFNLYGPNGVGQTTTLNFIDTNNYLETIYGGDVILRSWNGIQFQTNHDAATGMFILPGGNVGIGTTNAAYKLDINGSLGVGGTAYFGSKVGIGTTAPTYQLETTGNLKVGSTAYFVSNVGIGTTAPGYALDVNGTLGVGGTGYFASHLGLGNTAPTQRLDITGNATLSGTLSLGPNAQAYAGTCDASAAGKQYYDGPANIMYYCNGTSWITMGSSTTVTGSGTTNYLPKWNRASSLTNSLLYDDGTNIGIGKTNPGYQLELTGTLGVGGTAWFGSRVGIGTTAPTSSLDVNGTAWLRGTGTSGLFVDSNGNVGIGKTNPGYQVELSSSLGVGGTAWFGSKVGIGTTAPTYQLETTGNLKIGSTAYFVSNVGIGTTAPLAALDVNGNASISGNLSFSGIRTIAATAMNNLIIGDASTGNLALLPGLNVGIGKSNPSYKLDINGTLGVGSTAYFASNVGVGTTAPTYQLETTGNLKVGSTAYFVSNVGIGTTAPGATLDINGTLKIGTLDAGATDTVLTHSSNIVQSRTIDSRVWGSSLADFSGTGNANYLAKFSDDNTILKSILYETGSQIGIGKTNPAYQLDLSSSLGVGSTAYFASNVGIGTTAPTYALDVTGSLGVGGTGYFASYLGLGNATPTQRLDVNGNATISGTLSLGPNAPAYAGTCNATIAGKQYYDGTDNTMYYCNGTSWKAMTGTAGGSVGGSGTQNYIPKWSASTTLTNSLLYDDGTNIGIGLTNPGYKLEVNGNLKIGSTAYFASNVGIGTTAPATGNLLEVAGTIGATMFVDTANPAYFLDPASSTTSLFVAGNVGVGATSPGYKLYTDGALGVGGTAWFGSNVGIGTTAPTYQLETTGNLKIGSTAYFVSNVGIGTTTPLAALDVIGNASTSGNLTFRGTSPATLNLLNGDRFDIQTSVGGDAGLAPRLTVANGGNIGIGRTVPNYTLDLNGTLGVGSTAYFASNLGVGTSAPTYQLETTGNLKIGSTAYFVSNVGIGTTAPGATLDIVGNLKIGTLDAGATDTVLTHSLNIIQQRTIDSRVWGTSLVDFSGTGNANYLAKFSDDDTVLKSILYETASQIGVGKTNPSYQLDLSSSLGVGGTAYFVSNVGIGTTAPATGNLLEVAGTIGATMFVDTANPAYFLDPASSTTSLFVAGNVGVGATSPNYNLYNNGSLGVGGTAYFASKVGIGNTAPIYSLDVTGSLGIGGTGYFASNLGIGNTAPTQRLDITGNATISGTLSLGPNAPAYAGTCNATNAGKQYYDGTDNKMYYCNGTSWITMGTSSSLSGSGTQNYLPKWSGATTLTNSLIFDDGTYVGIGLTNPGYKLEVNGNLKIGSTAYFASNVGVGTTAPTYQLETTGNLRIGSTAYFVSNVGIGTTAPAVGNLLEVSGTIGAAMLVDTANSAYFVDPAASTTSLFVAGNVGIGATSPGYKLYTDGALGVGGTVWFGSNVGIGTTAPGATLDINGTLKIGTLDAGATNTILTHSSNIVQQRTIDSRVWGSSLLDFSGTGNANYLAKFSDDNTVLQSILYETGNQIGIGKTNPGYQLDLSGSLGVGSTAYFGSNMGIGTTAPTATLDVVGDASASGSLVFRGTSPATIDILNGDRLDLQTSVGGDVGLTPRLTIANDGKVGIGTTAPDALFVVSSPDADGQAVLKLENTAGTDSNFEIRTRDVNSQTEFWAGAEGSEANVMTFLSGNVGIGLTNPAYKLEVNGSLGIGGTAWFGSNVGIGTTAPTYQLETTGNLKIGSTAYFVSNVGIGTTSPLAALDVIGNASTSGNLTFRGTSPANLNLLNGDNFNVQTSVGGDAGLTPVLSILNNGNIGVGTTAPTTKLEVAGDVGAAKFFDTANTAYFLDPAAGVSMFVAGNVGVGATSPGYKLYTDGALGVGGTAWFGSNVGIGTTAPIVMLQIGNLDDSSDPTSVAGPKVFLDGDFSSETDLSTHGRIYLGSKNFGIGAGHMTTGEGGFDNDLYLWSYNGAGRDIRFMSTADGDGAPSTFTTNMIIQGDTGNVGIGTTAPTAKLDIVGDASTSGSLVFRGTSPATIDILNGDRLDFQTSVGGDAGLAPVLSILNNGSIGIGTTAPSTTLELKASKNALADPGIFANYHMVVRDTDTGTGEGVGLAFNNGTIDDNVGASIIFKRTDAFAKGELQFYTKQSNVNGDDPVQAMVINDAGNIGIGTTAPSNKLDVAGNFAAGFNGTAGITGGGFVASYSNSAGNRVFKMDGENSVLSLSNDHMYIRTTTAAKDIYLQPNSATAMTLKAGGNVGIGTTAPAYPLTVYAASVPGLQLTSSTTGAASTDGFTLALSSDDVYLNQRENKDMLFYTNGAFRAIIKAGGNVGIGITAPGQALDVVGTIRQSGCKIAGTLSANTSGDIICTSDERLKNIYGYYDGGLDVLSSINPIRFSYKGEDFIHVGFSAQNVKSVLPEASALQDSGYWSLDATSVTALTINSIKELNSRLTTANNQISSLSTELASNAEILKDINLTSTGDLNISQNTADTYQITDSSGNIIQRIGAFAELAVANLKTGALQAQEVTSNSLSVATDNVSVAGQSLQDYIVGVVNNAINNGAIQQLASQDQNQKLVSPEVQTSTLTIPDDATGSGFGELLVQNQGGQTVASIDSQGNATFNGEVTSDQINSNNLEVSGDATVGGTLYADEIITKHGKFGDLLADQVTAATVSAQYITNIYNIYNTPSATPTPTEAPTPTPTPDTSGLAPTPTPDLSAPASTDSGLLTDTQNWSLFDPSQDLKINSNVSITGTTNLARTVVAGTFSQDGSLIIDQGNSINVTTGTLYIQNMGLGGVDILAGKVLIDVDGNVQIAGNLAVGGEVSASKLTLNQKGSGFGNLLEIRDQTGNTLASVDASGSANFAQVETNKIIIASDNQATPSGSLGQTTINTNATAGEAILPAGVTEITINSQFVTDKTLVYVTPISDTRNKVLYIKAKQANDPTTSSTGWFQVGIDAPLLNQDIRFNWWIIN